MIRAQNTNQVPPPFRSARDPLQDVVTRRTERTILKGNLKALVHNLSHLGQAFDLTPEKLTFWPKTTYKPIF